MTIYTPYFYIIEDTRNGMYYAGCQYSKKASPDMLLKEGGYETTSKTIRKIIQECGIKVFKIRKLRVFPIGKQAN